MTTVRHTAAARRRARRPGRPAVSPPARRTRPPTALPGHGSRDPEASSSAAPSLDPQDALLQFAQCMRDHGVDVPDPVDGHLTVDGRGRHAGADGRGRERMREVAADGRAAGRRQPLSEEEKQAFLDQAKCMRDRGWNVSDPVFDGGRVSQHVQAGATAAPGDPKPGDPQFEKDIRSAPTRRASSSRNGRGDDHGAPAWAIPAPDRSCSPRAVRLPTPASDPSRPPRRLARRPRSSGPTSSRARRPPASSATARRLRSTRGRRGRSRRWPPWARPSARARSCTRSTPDRSSVSPGPCPPGGTSVRRPTDGVDVQQLEQALVDLGLHGGARADRRPGLDGGDDRRGEAVAEGARRAADRHRPAR